MGEERAAEEGQEGTEEGAHCWGVGAPGRVGEGGDGGW